MAVDTHHEMGVAAAQNCVSFAASFRLATSLWRSRRLEYTPLAYMDTMFTFIESSAFARACSVYLDDDEYAELQQFMMQNPEAGQLVPGSGGVRKLRWSRPGTGKRGGLRVIYFVAVEPNEFWMLTIYSKAKRDDVPGHVLKQLLEVFRNG
jgi:hypothetical protein